MADCVVRPFKAVRRQMHRFEIGTFNIRRNVILHDASLRNCDEQGA